MQEIKIDIHVTVAEMRLPCWKFVTDSGSNNGNERLTQDLPQIIDREFCRYMAGYLDIEKESDRYLTLGGVGRGEAGIGYAT